MLESGPGVGNALPQTTVGRGSLTKLFKEGLHEAGPGVEVGCVHIQVGDFFCCEEGGEHASSEDGGDLLTVRRGQVSPVPLGLLSHTGQTTLSLPSMCTTGLTSLPFGLCFHLYVVTEDLLPRMKGCPEPSMENRILGLLRDSQETGALAGTVSRPRPLSSPQSREGSPGHPPVLSLGREAQRVSGQ